MSMAWQRIARCKSSIQSILDEIEAAQDPDLWEEADGKLTDVAVTYRRTQTAPTHFRFSDGVRRDLTEMAFEHARNAVSPEIEEALEEDDA